MQQKQFLDNLTAVADIAKVRGDSRVNNKKEPVTVWRQGQEIEIDTKSNPTLAVQLKKLKSQKHVCEDCHNSVTDRVVNCRLYSYPVPHWRTTCEACNMVKNPQTKQFDIKCIRAPAFFLSYLKTSDK
jgi:hypothetical protein